MANEKIRRRFTLSRMTDKASGGFLRSLAASRGRIVSSFTIARNLSSYRHASMFFVLEFDYIEHLAAFQAYGYETEEMEKISRPIPPGSGAVVDRTFENSPEDPEIVVTLPCGHKERFFETGLTDEEYIKRTERLKGYD